MDVIFARDRDTYVPTALARGPWDQGACHGGAPAALIAQVVDGLPSLAPMQIARMTLEILRPVPIAPLVLRHAIEREGKRIQTVAASLFAGDDEVVRARVLRMRVADLALPEDTPVLSTQGVGRPGDATPLDLVGQFPDDWGTTFIDAMDLRWLGSPPFQPSESVGWFRLRVPLIEGEVTSQIARVAAAADFGNGVAPPLQLRDHRFVNPDLTVAVVREPVGEWVALRSVSMPESNGRGLTRTELHDETGILGSALQTLYIDER